MMSSEVPKIIKASPDYLELKIITPVFSLHLLGVGSKSARRKRKVEREDDSDDVIQPRDCLYEEIPDGVSAEHHNLYMQILAL